MKSSEIPFQLHAVSSGLSETASKAERILGTILLLVFLIAAPLVPTALSKIHSTIGMLSLRTTFISQVGQFELTLKQEAETNGWHSLDVFFITSNRNTIRATGYDFAQTGNYRTARVTVGSEGGVATINVETANATPDESVDLNKAAVRNFTKGVRSAVVDTARQVDLEKVTRPPSVSIGGVTTIADWFPYVILGLALYVRYLHRIFEAQKSELNTERAKVTQNDADANIKEIMPYLERELLAKTLKEKSWYPLGRSFIFALAILFFFCGLVLALRVTLSPQIDQFPLVFEGHLLPIWFDGFLVVVALIFIRRSIPGD